MEILNIIINDKEYTYIDSISIDDKNYVAYSDNQNINISEYKIINNTLEFFDIDDETFHKIKEVLNL